MQPKRILSVSHDPSLLSTRERILRSAGFEVESTLSIDQAIKSIEMARFDLILIGHTVPILERKELIEYSRHRDPSVPSRIHSLFSRRGC
jgi:DNA-binding NtrC family response regulator